MNWKMEGKLPDGHRLFSTTDNGVKKYALADDSGHTPDLTDDGVLWLDATRCLGVDKDDSFDPPREYITIPVVDSNGKSSYAVTDASTMLHLANLLKWQVEDEDNKAIYEIR